jgi:hypothetical protein
MCLNCVINSVLGIDRWDGENPPFDSIRFPESSPDMIELASLIKPFYELPHCGTGGPLHISLDDFNLDDDCLAFCRASLDNEDAYWSDNIAVIKKPALRILDLCIGMSEAERATAVARGWQMLPS